MSLTPKYRTAMLKFLQNEERTFLGKCANIALGFILLVIWAVIVVAFYKWLFASKSWNPFGQILIYEHPFFIQIFLTCIMAPLWEELVFRKLPLDIVKATEKKELIIPVILFTSVIFGLVHQGVPSILLQGAGGFVIACVYIKNGYSYWSSVTLHAMWNISLTFGILTL